MPYTRAPKTASLASFMQLQGFSVPPLPLQQLLLKLSSSASLVLLALTNAPSSHPSSFSSDAHAAAAPQGEAEGTQPAGAEAQMTWQTEDSIGDPHVEIWERERGRREGNE